GGRKVDGSSQHLNRFDVIPVSQCDTERQRIPQISGIQTRRSAQLDDGFRRLFAALERQPIVVPGLSEIGRLLSDLGQQTLLSFEIAAIPARRRELITRLNQPWTKAQGLLECSHSFVGVAHSSLS